MQPHTLLHKNVEEICNACSNFIVVTKQEILVIYLTDFFDAASWRHNDVTLLLATRRVSGNDFVFQQDSVLAHRAAARATVELLRQEMPNFLAPNLWPPNSPDLSPVDYEIWAVMQHRVYHRQIHVDELKRRLTDVWWGLEQSIFDEAIDQWRGRYWAYVHAKEGHFKYGLWSNNVDFVYLLHFFAFLHIFYIQYDLFDCCIFN